MSVKFNDLYIYEIASHCYKLHHTLALESYNDVLNKLVGNFTCKVKYYDAECSSAMEDISEYSRTREWLKLTNLINTYGAAINGIIQKTTFNVWGVDNSVEKYIFRLPSIGCVEKFGVIIRDRNTLKYYIASPVELAYLDNFNSAEMESKQ